MMEDNREWEDVIIRIEHADHDDEVEIYDYMLPMTLDEAIGYAKAQIIRTWDECFDENAGMDGFPYYGVAIELAGCGANTGIDCHSQSLRWEADDIVGEWEVDGGMLTYSFEK